MRPFNRVLGFIAVGFVLVFMGKVNKTSLYTVYFKTIADVEVRNSQALDLGDAHFVTVLAPKSHQPLKLTTPSFSADLSTAVFQPLTIAKAHVQLPSQPQAVPVGLRCFMEIAPRAPGA